VEKGLIFMSINSLTILRLHALLGHWVAHFLAMVLVFHVILLSSFSVINFFSTIFMKHLIVPLTLLLFIAFLIRYLFIFICNNLMIVDEYH